MHTGPGSGEHDGAHVPEAIIPVAYNPPVVTSRTRSLLPRPAAVMVMAGLLLSAAAAWYLLTGKSVYFATDPAGATLSISGPLSLKLADRYLLRRGMHELVVTAEGYYPLQTIFEVGEPASQTFRYTLTPLPGSLDISTSPEVAARVFVDEVETGQTPLTVEDLVPGSYSIRLETDRYFDYQTEVDITGRAQRQTLTAELVPAWANLNLASQPSGAEIFVNDEPRGNTPAALELLEGEHQLRIRHNGYKPWTRVLRIRAGADQDITDIQLEQADAVIQIITRPDRAGVTVDGQYIGLSPVEAAVAPGRQAQISVFKPGYRQITRNLTANPGDNQALTLELAEETAPIRISAVPADAEIYVNGVFRGNADQMLELPAVDQSIEIRKTGYVSYQTRIIPRPGIAQEITVTLKTLEQARLDAIKPELQVAGDLTLRLLEPDSIVMGASRREPGRRANEVIRQVAFTKRIYLSTTEVTNAQFRRYLPGHDSGEVEGNSLDDDNQPVVNVSWHEAAGFCNWLSEQASLPPVYVFDGDRLVGMNPDAGGYRLPTEAEWAWAARSRVDASPLRFPWGDEMPVKADSGNYADISAAPVVGSILRDYNDQHIVSAAVASFPANRLGLHDLGGNVAEWVHDFYDIPMIPPEQTQFDPAGPETGEHHVIRGASWAHGSLTELRLSFRDYGLDGRPDVGFRLARTIR